VALAVGAGTSVVGRVAVAVAMSAGTVGGRVGLVIRGDSVRDGVAVPLRGVGRGVSVGGAVRTGVAVTVD
jgi:hypothetical protein